MEKAKASEAAPYDQFGGFVHPTQRPLPSGGMYWSGGLTVRDWFAGQALTAIITNARAVFPDAKFTPWERHAEEAYKVADAMLAERSKS